MREYILFDLDGTLTDPGIGITNSVSYALKKYGIEVNDRSELYPYIGPPLQYSFEKFHGLPKSELQNALMYYREYFAQEGIFQNELYPGIPELLEKLRGAGASLMVATSKPEEFTHRILEHFGLARFFDFVGGNTLDESRPTKAEVIEHVLISNPGVSTGNAVMIGDREYDITGAHKCSLEAVGVLYGYGSLDELFAAGADFIASDIPGLEKILLSL